MKKTLIILFVMISITLGCQTKEEQEGTMTFQEDLEFLKKHTDVILLSDEEGQAQVVVSAGMQGRVLTSTASGGYGRSFGWVNYDLIASGERNPHFNPFGGEDRFWLGPEGGQYSIYFEKGNPFKLDYWHVPSEFDWEKWQLKSKTNNRAEFSKKMKLTNCFGFTFDFEIDRTIRLLQKSDVTEKLGVEFGANLKVVAFESENTITNTGEMAWHKETGLLSIWILGMFTPSPTTTIVVPFKQGSEDELGPIVNDEYFGKVPPARLKIKSGTIYFKGDGKQRSKIGVPPNRCLYIAGSYNEKDQVLTIIKMSPPEGPDHYLYVNSLWEIQKDPYGGDVINAYNDGPLEPGEKSMGPFYELESSSPGAQLDPGESITHCHTTFHFKGDETDLDKITQELFKVTLEEIKSVF